MLQLRLTSFLLEDTTLVFLYVCLVLEIIYEALSYLFIYLFMAVLGLCCCVRAFSSCGERGLQFVAVHGLLIVVASLVAEHGL